VVPIFGVPMFGVDIWWVDTLKGTPLEYMLSVGTIGLQENFSLLAVHRIPKILIFLLRLCWSAHLRNFPSFSLLQSPLPTH